MISLSMPISSKVRISSCVFSSLSSFASSDFLVRSICLTWKREPSAFFSSSMPAIISLIWSCKIDTCLSLESGIMPSCEWPIITASKSPVAIFANSCWRFSFLKSFFVATRIFAPGYNFWKSSPICSVRWFGTAKRGFVQSPSLLLSIAAAIISNVLPAPTQCANSVLPPNKACAIAFFWCSFSVIAEFIPGNLKAEPSYSRGRIELNCRLYCSTRGIARSGSLNIQSLKACLIFAAFCWTIFVALISTTLRSFSLPFRSR